MINSLWVYKRGCHGRARDAHSRGSVEREEIRRLRPPAKGRRSNILKFRRPKKARHS